MNLENVVTVEMRSVEELVPFKRNPYRHPAKQLDMLKKSIRQFGFTNPILVAKDNFIIAGHARLQAAKELGIEFVPTITYNMPYHQAVAYVVTDNQIGKLAEEDKEELTNILVEVSEFDDIDFEATGFTLEELEGLLEATALDDEDEVEEEAEKAVSKYFNISNDKMKIFHAVLAPDVFCENFDYLIAYSQGASHIPEPPKNSIVFVDSGALSGVLAKGPEYVSIENQEKVVRWAEDNHAHWVTMMDIPMIKAVLDPLKKTKEEAYKIHIRNAKAFSELATHIRKVFVIQGPDYADYKRCCQDMVSFIKPDDVVAIGSIKDRSTDVELIVKITALVKSFFPENDIHLFGITVPETVAKCVQVGATSCDSASVSFALRTGNVLTIVPKENKWGNSSVTMAEYCGADVPLSMSDYLRSGTLAMGMLNLNLAIHLTMNKMREQYEDM